jgi:hypothetical protein
MAPAWGQAAAQEEGGCYYHSICVGWHQGRNRAGGPAQEYPDEETQCACYWGGMGKPMSVL